MTGNTRRIKWGHVLDEARTIVNSYDTPVTLRQLFYRLVAAQTLDNSEDYAVTGSHGGRNRRTKTDA